MKNFQTILLLTLAMGTNPISTYCQEAVATVNGVVIERVEKGRRGVANVRVLVDGVDDKLTDGDGAFDFKVPIEDIGEPTEIQIEVSSSDYTMLHPYEGRIGVNKNKLTLFIELQVLSGEAENHYINQIKTYQASLSTLEKENASAIEELNRLNKTMIDTINYFYLKQQASEKIINTQIEKLKEAAKEKQELNEQIVLLENTLQSARDSISSLTQQLYIALEEAYLRKKGLYNVMTGDLKEYLVRVKDLNDRLLVIENFFPSKRNPAFVKEYNAIGDAYNTIFLKLNENQENYLEGVRHNWKSASSITSVEQTFSILFDKLHFPVLQSEFQKLNVCIVQNKIKKGKKQGLKMNQQLSPLIESLEKQIQHTIHELDKEFK